MHELEQVDPDTGEWTEAKLDIDVVTREGRFLLDISVFHPFLKAAKGKLRYNRMSEREKKKYDRYPTHRDGRRVTDAVLVPIILNTYGAVGDKATEFFNALAGAKAKRIIEEISMLSVLLSAEMILQSHAPSNLSNLLQLPQPAEPGPAQVAQPPESQVEQIVQHSENDAKSVEKDENGFLRPDLRGEVQGNKVECLGCSNDKKKVPLNADCWSWNRHVRRKHLQQPASQQDAEPVEPAPHPAAHPAAQPAEPAAQQAARPVEPATHSAAHSAAKQVEPAAQPAAQPAPRKRPKQPARQRVPQDELPPFHRCGGNCTLVGKDGASFSKAPSINAKFFQSAPKEQGTSEPAKVCNVPSRTPIKAGLQANADSVISNSAHAHKPSNDNVTFSSKNAKTK